MDLIKSQASGCQVSTQGQSFRHRELGEARFGRGMSWCVERFSCSFFFYRIFRQMMFYHNDVSLPESTSWLRLDYVWSVEEHLRSSSVSIGFHRPHPSMSTDPRCVILLCAGHFGLTLCQAGWQWWGADTNVTSGCCSKAGWDWLRSGGVPLYNKTTTTWNVYANICIYYM